MSYIQLFTTGHAAGHDKTKMCLYLYLVNIQNNPETHLKPHKTPLRPPLEPFHTLKVTLFW